VQDLLAPHELRDGPFSWRARPPCTS
jgi:hypothetical protein